MTDQNKENESKELMHEAHEAIERLRAACPLGNVRTPMHIAQHFIDHTAWLDENLERAKKRNNLLCTEQDQLREALGIDVTVDLVDEVRRLKEAQREAVPAQVIGLEATIKERDEQWNKVCEALGLPDKGRTPEAQVVVHAHETANALEVAEAKVEAFRAMNSIIQDNWDLHTSMDGNPVHMLGQLMDELQRLRRTPKHGEHENTRIKGMDAALETSLMEIAKQAQVIDELRSQLKAAQRAHESQRKMRRDAEGKIDGLERAIAILGGRR